MPRLPRCLLALVCSVLLLNAVVGGEDPNTTAPLKTPAEIERLIKQLGSDEFDQREAASKALEAIGEPALEALLKAATKSDDAEVCRRAEAVVEAIERRLSGGLRCFKGHTDEVCSVTFSPDGKLALSGSRDETLRLWDVETGKVQRCFKGHTFTVSSVAFSPNGKRAISGSWDNTVRLWDVETGKELRCFKGHKGSVWDIAFSPDGTRAMSGSADGTLRLWDMEKGGEQRSFPGHSHGDYSVAFSPDGKRALSAGQDMTLRLWDVGSGKALRCFEGHTQSVSSVAFSPDGKRALSGSDDKTMRLWQLPAEAGPPPGQPTSVARPKGS